MPVHAILARYPIGAVHTTSTVSSGLMHQTHFVDADSGAFVLQRLHAKLATQAILNDYRAVTAHLAAKGAAAPKLVQTHAGEGVAADGAGHLWRLTTRVTGHTRARVTTRDEAEQGARALGRFHRIIADIPHVFQSAHPLHDTIGHLARLEAATVSHPEHVHRVTDEITQIRARLPALLLPADLPRRVVHGDPKISNVMFDGDRAVGLIDLDTCNTHTVLVDLGDAVRSWCRNGREDEPEAFHLDRFEAILQGYAAEGPALTAAERSHLASAGELITLELASRFARDVLEDEYFGYDAARYPSRREHNVARTRGMLHLAGDMARHRPLMQALVAQYFG
jgi:Ser/Thr protein kinase RdoA (MazF antagonist)